jgi:hypothetical protein
MPFLYKLAFSLPILIVLSCEAGYASIKSIPVLVIVKREACN